MLQFKTILILCVILTVCLADDSQEVGRRKKHKFHLLYGGGIAYYLIFLAIKIKLIFIIGATIASAIFVGKVFAFFKYITLWLEEKKAHFSPEHHENIVIQADPHHSWSSSGPGEEYYHRKSDDSSDSNNGGYTTIRDDQSYQGYTSYARSLGDAIFDNFDIVKDIIDKLDLTEYTFDDMSIKKESCKKRFVCEADYRSKNSSLLALGLYMFSDRGLDKYRTDHEISSIAECQTLYPDCETLQDTT